MQKFLKDSRKEVYNCPQSYFKVPKQLLTNSIKLAEDVIELRDDSSTRLINYDNILQHFPKLELNIERILKNVNGNRIQTIEGFRGAFEVIIQTIQSFNAVLTIRKT